MVPGGLLFEDRFFVCFLDRFRPHFGSQKMVLGGVDEVPLRSFFRPWAPLWPKWPQGSPRGCSRAPEVVIWDHFGPLFGSFGVSCGSKVVILGSPPGCPRDPQVVILDNFGPHFGAFRPSWGSKVIILDHFGPHVGAFYFRLHFGRVSYQFDFFCFFHGPPTDPPVQPRPRLRVEVWQNHRERWGSMKSAPIR